jgi:uncharacterized protein (DUF3084 family)
MNKSVIYIVGATVLLGGGAYLFLKNKKAKDLSKLEDLKTDLLTGNVSTTTPSGNLTPAQVEVIKNNIASGNTTTPSGIVLSTPEQVAQVVNLANQQNQLNAQAQSIASEIRSLKAQLLGVLAQTTSSFGTTLTSQASLQKGIINMKINQLTAKLKSLGYKEVNGVAVKLVEVTTTTLV